MGTNSGSDDRNKGIHVYDESKEERMCLDHNSSDLAPQRQEMSVENVSSGLVPQGQKASDYDNSDPGTPFDKPFGKMVLAKGGYEEQKDEDQTFARMESCTDCRCYAGHIFFSNISDGRENGISKWSTEGGGLCCSAGRGVDPGSSRQVLVLRKALYD
ncbi:hypothetical protein Tco_0941163 [Tanacetum coccineum]|uniref:Uncharacterized protein n=1 Tax=Tanacetum coccineum TaxID=301880 RepID=A0ABQ5DRM7_9ASTR